MIGAVIVLAGGCGRLAFDPVGIPDDVTSDGRFEAPDSQAFAQRAFIKASNTGAGDGFGRVALSADGSTLAVGAGGERSASTGVDGDQADNTAQGAGAVYVFVRSGTTWAQQAYLKASNTEATDFFGSELALTADGSTLAVGAPGEDSGAVGVDGNQADNDALSSGAVYVFTRAGTTWSQQSYLKPSNSRIGQFFGGEGGLAFSTDGSTLAIGAYGEDSAATGVGGNQNSTAAPNAGAVYVFIRAGTTWIQQVYLKASNTDADDGFGSCIALSGDGAMLAIGASGESSGDAAAPADNSVSRAGAVYVFTRVNTIWTQQAYLKAFNPGVNARLGTRLALATDGATLVVGAPGEASRASGIDGDQADTSAPSAGAAYVFTRGGTAWTQQAYLKASNTDPGDAFGRVVALSDDGSIVAVGAWNESSAASGIDGDQADNMLASAGAVYMFGRVGTGWSQRAYIKASNPGGSDQFGRVALGATGSTLAIGADFEDSAATGIDGAPSESAGNSGAVYVFE